MVPSMFLVFYHENRGGWQYWHKAHNEGKTGKAYEIVPDTCIVVKLLPLLTPNKFCVTQLALLNSSFKLTDQVVPKPEDFFCLSADVFRSSACQIITNLAPSYSQPLYSHNLIGFFVQVSWD